MVHSLDNTLNSSRGDRKSMFKKTVINVKAISSRTRTTCEAFVIADADCRAMIHLFIRSFGVDHGAIMQREGHDVGHSLQKMICRRGDVLDD